MEMFVCAFYVLTSLVYCACIVIVHTCCFEILKFCSKIKLLKEPQFEQKCAPVLREVHISAPLSTHALVGAHRAMMGALQGELTML